jgi:uracil-DNA glycosylase
MDRKERKILLIKRFGKQWYEKLEDHLYSKEFLRIGKELKESKGRICPSPENIFRGFKITEYSDVKVVILGQDPYHTYKNNKPIANGLAFSSGDANFCPPSLRNILDEVERDVHDGLCFGECLEYDLTRWAKQGVLLLNTSLSTIESKPGFHSKLWKEFTKEVISKLNEKNDLVWMLWGKHAQSYKEFINNDTHLILETSHPSPYSVKYGFKGCGHFSKCNEFLKSRNIKEINF